jgi:RNA polymerase sigma-70 factor (ECF subfamily)
MGELTGSLQSDVSFEQTEPLVVRLRAGEEQAFTEVFELYKGLVFTLCRKLLTDRTEAHDVTQDVFLTLFKKVRSFRGECSLKTWLYRVTLNQAANRNRWWKRRSRNRTISLSLSRDESTPTLDIPSGQPTPDRKAWAGELQKAIRTGLESLPFEQRAAIVLRDVQGLHYEEIAEVTGVSVGTVKSRIARGRDRLRVILHDFRSGRPK